MDKNEIIERLERLARCAVHTVGELPFVMSLDDGIAIHEAIDMLRSQPERKKGKWIDYTEDGYVECPFCHSATNCDGNKDELHFCFSCGADMRGEQE